MRGFYGVFRDKDYPDVAKGKFGGVKGWISSEETVFSGLDRDGYPVWIFRQDIVYSWRVAFVRWLRGRL